ncbi:hypothetical protein TanjilG_06036 [Lupinus angustifolius]|uniref:DUF7950 domain-containing protein n=1 Tax=Lupinus angustifolius TaxID=3871 RepID=A0A4P1RJD0_LUPAN|nr:PREDICTED: uncharacterized protein LOC109347140 [Lupinus angustifolius]OIW12247.1 hypothetical protein TanjilG_06036 [Lupinus angustifolius]
MNSEDMWRVSSREGFPHDNRILNTIMLRYRPIAPKPVSDGSIDPVQVNRINGSVSGKRVKRKYVRVRRNNGYLRKNNDKSPEKLVESRDGVAVMTLQLLPENDKPEEESSLVGDSWCKSLDLNLTMEKIQILDKNQKPLCMTANVSSGSTLDPSPVVESSVTVESVTGTCMVEEGGEGCTDREKLMNLETDTCPGFLSDGYWNVRWLNDAFKRMIVDKKEPFPEMVVLLKVKNNSVWRCCYSYPSFTCSVRLQYTWRNEKCTKMVPCDVLRLESGGFAWRLDVKAALSLGL